MSETSTSDKDVSRPSWQNIWNQSVGPSNFSEGVALYLKGFAMGTADVIPGVSGGTIAFVSGIYDSFLAALSSVNGKFFKNIFRFELKQAFSEIHFKFMLVLGFGMVSAILSTARVMHYLIVHQPVFTWSAFMGLIAASIIYVGKQIEDKKSPINWMMLGLGTVVAFSVVSLIPVSTPNHSWFIMLCGLIGVCAMILPGLSGSFLLLILGKYEFITGAVKAPFVAGNLQIILTFLVGTFTGLFTFSKLLKWFLERYHAAAMALLTGFMIGAMKKVWPWKVTLESKVVRGKTLILREANVFPQSFDAEVMISFGLFIFGFVLVFILERAANKQLKN
jgi:putative membrane protein